MKKLILLGLLVALPAKAKLNSSVKTVHIVLASSSENHIDVSASPNGEMFYRGLELGLKQMNERLQSKNIVLKWQRKSIGSDLNSYKALAKEFAKNKQPILMGPIFSSTTLLAAKALRSLKNPPLMIAPAATASGLEKYDDFLLPTALANKKQGAQLAKLIPDTSNKIAIITAVDCIYCQDLKTSFVESLPKNTKLQQVSVLSDDQEFKDVANQLKNNNWDFILLPNYELLNARLIAALSKANIKVATYLGGDGWGRASNAFFDIVQTHPFSALTLSHWQALSDNHSNWIAKKFSNDYRKAYGEFPSEITALAFNSTLILEKIILAANLSKNNQITSNDLKLAAAKPHTVQGLLGSIFINQFRVSQAPMILNKYGLDKSNKTYSQIGRVINGH